MGNFSEVSDLLPAARKYDLYSQALKSDPYPVFARMRKDNPVFRQPGLDGHTAIWFLTRYDDVERLLRDETHFVRDPHHALPGQPTGQHASQPNALALLLENHMLNRDGADHRRLRDLVSQAFTPARIQLLRPRIQRLADELIDAMQPRGQMDLIADYAFQLPTIVIAEMLGAPVEDREHFKTWSHALVAPPLDQEARVRTAHQLQEFVGYLSALFAARRRAPRDDLISALLKAEAAGDQLREPELFSTVALLIIAGHETTVGLIGNASLALLQRPEVWRALVQDSARVAAAIEELLRYDSPVERALNRWVAQDVEIGGQQLRRGDVVIGVLGAANRDPDRFEQPDELNVGRGPLRHLAFGHGAHYCLGAPLGRLEGEVALTALLSRLPGLRLAAPAARLEWGSVPMFRALAALPVAWD